MEYAKLIDETVFFAPRVVIHDTQRIYNPPAELLAAQGFKPVQFTNPPIEESGYVAVPGWEETEAAVVQTWSLVPEGNIPDTEALEILLGGEIT